LKNIVALDFLTYRALSISPANF